MPGAQLLVLDVDFFIIQEGQACTRDSVSWSMKMIEANPEQWSHWTLKPPIKKKKKRLLINTDILCPTPVLS